MSLAPEEAAQGPFIICSACPELNGPYSFQGCIGSIGIAALKWLNFFKKSQLSPNTLYTQQFTAGTHISPFYPGMTKFLWEETKVINNPSPTQAVIAFKAKRSPWKQIYLIILTGSQGSLMGSRHV